MIESKAVFFGQALFILLTISLELRVICEFLCIAIVLKIHIINCIFGDIVKSKRIPIYTCVCVCVCVSGVTNDNRRIPQNTMTTNPESVWPNGIIQYSETSVLGMCMFCICRCCS